MARTEEFLRKLKSGLEVPVGLGIWQNRLFVGDLTNFIARLAVTEHAEGIWHLGMSDHNEEIVFLRQLAAAFGYDPAQVVEGKEVNWNLCVNLGKIIQLPDLRIPREADTIAKVAAQMELSGYRK